MNGIRSHLLHDRFIHAAALACALVVAGCGPRITFVATHEQSYDSWDGTVRILDEMPSDEAYIELGVLVGHGRGRHDWGDILRALQKEGQKKGANAIVLICKKTSNPAVDDGSEIVGFYGSTYADKTMMVFALRILY